MTLSLSRRAEFVLQSEIRNMSIECDRVGGINLSQGICDTEVPLAVRRGAQAAIDEGVNSYTRYDGLADLREAIARKLRDHQDLSYDPETEIVVSAGSTGAFYCACLALLEPGDQVILFEPYYGYHLQTLLLAQAVPAYVRLEPPDWGFSREDLEKTWAPKTRAIVVNTPSNPTGKVFREEELGWIRDFATRHDLFVFTDEIYEYLLFDGRRHIPPARLPGMRERTMTISGLSKTFSITGWRVGYSACDRRWASRIGHLNDLIYVCAPAPLQAGAAAGLQALSPDYYRSLCRLYEEKRDKICRALAGAGLNPYPPQGAYYVIADISRLPGRSSKERAMALLRETGVACVPGEAFFRPGGGHDLARFCFAKTDADLDEAGRRLERLRI